VKIFFSNCGYATGLTGRYSEYLFLSWRYLRLNTESLAPIVDCIKYEKPEIVALVEMNFRQYKYLKKVLREEYPHTCEVDKYGRSFWHKILPIRNVNMILSKQPIEKTSHLLFKHGTKRGILKVQIGRLHILLVHLALGRAVRTKQIAELKEMLFHQKSTICAGDFNTFLGGVEISSILEEDKFISVNKKHLGTFPSYSPSKELDYVLGSPDVHLTKFHVLPETFSDHRALMFELEPL
jgi:endonuclease/exonuclease/phosphatase family metal-dependent hydrolase